jgi:hypothetical protein
VIDGVAGSAHPWSVRRALFLLAFAACERRPPGAATAAPLFEPLVIGHSPESVATGEPADPGAVVDGGTSPPTRDAASAIVWTGCHLDAKGMNGGLTADAACVIEQEYDRHSFDAGAIPFLGVWDSLPRLPGDPAIRIGLRRTTIPVVGVQPAGSFHGWARIELDTGMWEASVNPFSGTTMGLFTLTLTKVRDAGHGAYEIHGKVDARLIPDWQGTGTGWIDLHVDF